MGDDAFRTCGMCRKQWPRWQEFVLDRGLRLLGFQGVPQVPDANAIIFEHECGSSVSILAAKLRHLLENPEEGAGLPLLFGSEQCKGHCRFLADLEACTNRCLNARDRRLTILVNEIKQTGRLPAWLSR
jgi:hypothetical protein